MSESDTEIFGAERPRNPFGNGQEVATRPVASMSSLATVEQQRVLGELQAMIMLARANPRDQQQAVDNILRDCSRVSLAQSAMYEYARGGTDIKGPSIKLLEAIARRWGNISAGWKVISSDDGASEVISYALDLETGYRDERQFQVRHIRDTRRGPVKLVEERDIYELLANSAQRRKRANLMAVIPADVIEAAIEQCSDTLSANVDTSVEGLKKMLKAFSEFEVTQAQIEQRIQCRLDAISPGQVIQLSRIYTSLKDGISVPSQWFRAVDPPRQPTPRPPQQGQQGANPPPPQQQGTVRANPTPAPSQPASEPDAMAVLVPTRQDPGARHADNQELSETEHETTEENQERFEHVVADTNGEPIDGEVHLDPLAWAQAFIALLNETADEGHLTLLQHNSDALLDARTMSPEADALLDGVGAEQAPEPPVDPDEQLTADILRELPQRITPAEVIEFSRSPVVMEAIKSWQKEGQTGRVASVKSAFTARLEALRRG